MKIVLLFICLFFHSPLIQAAIPLKAEPESGSVNFLAVGKPSMLKIHGKASGAGGNFTLDKGELKGTAEFSLEKLDTGIKLRNEHMKEKYLKVNEHPHARLTLTEARVEDGFAESLTVTKETPFKGKLFLHGQDREVEGKFTATNGKLQAKLQLKLTDFGIEIPSYLGITVAELVDVNVEMQLKKD